MRGSGFDFKFVFACFIFALTYTYKKGRFRLSFIPSFLCSFFHPSFPTTVVSIGCTISGCVSLVFWSGGKQESNNKRCVFHATRRTKTGDREIEKHRPK